MVATTMKAMVLSERCPVERQPLQFTEVPIPVPGPREVLVRVRARGICRTDLHVVEGELPPRQVPLIPGHQIVGVVESCGEQFSASLVGTRVGNVWLHETCGQCRYCRQGKANLCEQSHFTGHTENGGFAEFVAAPAQFV